MTAKDLPLPAHDPDPAWEIHLARALGYTVPDQLGERMPDGSAPTAWNLRRNPFAFLEETREIIAWEVDGEPDDTGIRRARIDPMNPDSILLRPIRYPIPDGFEFVTRTDPDGTAHRIVLQEGVL